MTIKTIFGIMSAMIDVGEYTGLYLYSAILQANMALLALLGVFVIFRLERVDNTLQRLDDQITKFLRDFFSPRTSLIPSPVFEHMRDIGGLEEAIKEHLREPNPLFKVFLTQLIQHKSFEDLMGARGKEANRHQVIVKSFGSPFFLLMTVVIASLVLLPTASLVHSCLRWAELPIIILMVVLNVVTLTQIGRFIRRILIMPDTRIPYIQ